MIRTCEKGFSLLEVLVAVAIIAIAFTGVLKLYSQSVSVNMAANFYAKAPLLAQQILGEWETGMECRGEPFSLSETFDGYKGFTFEIREEDRGELLAPEKNTGAAPRLVQLYCTIFYNGGGLQYSTTALRLAAPWE